MGIPAPLLFCFLGSLLLFQAKAQVLEDFSDGDLLSNPTWHGNIAKWSVEGGKLRSANTVENSDFYVATPSSLLKNTEWRVSVDLSFNTSGLNYVDVYLAAHDSNLVSATQNAYFVRIGGTKDEICLYKKQGGAPILLIDGTDGTTNKNSNTISLKITCDNNYRWELNRNLSGTFLHFTSEGSSIDSSIVSSSYFGLYVMQSTSTFFQKHYFDNISVSPIVQDTVPPSLLSVTIENERKIKMVFDEELDTDWIKHTQFLALSNSLNKSILLDSFRIDQLDPTVLYAYPSSDLAGMYTLELFLLKDKAGNERTESLRREVEYKKPVQAGYRNIRISEFIPDPVPSAGLPEAEFIELLNTTDLTFDLRGYSISDPSTTVLLPSYLLPPHGYVILCRKSDSASFQSFGKVLALPSLPSLNNDRDVLTLKNTQHFIVDKVAYLSSWYKDATKDDGGYSLEIIDPSNICGGAENWKASNSTLGGTPGTQNSVWAILPDKTAPSVLSVNILSRNVVEVLFDETVDSLSLTRPNFVFSNDTQISQVTWKSDSLHKARLFLSSGLVTNTPYVLTIAQLKDCPGNTAESFSVDFVLSEPSKAGDVMVNELLSNPNPGGVDFVELYNNSPRYSDLKGWQLANMNADSVANKRVLSKTSLILKPQGYIVFTTNRNDILNNYPRARAENIVVVSSLPAYPDDAGNVVLLSPTQEIMDRFDYDASMQSPLLPKKDGVSLEKIHPTFPSNDRNNWASAAKEAGYATPGYQNSQLFALGLTEETVSIEPSVITPNGDGDRDFLFIHIQSDKVNKLGNIIIFNVLGKEVKRLSSNHLTGTDTYIQWDGTDESNAAVPLGHYIIWIELLDKEGKVIHYKKKAVVGEKM